MLAYERLLAVHPVLYKQQRGSANSDFGFSL